MYSFDVVGYVYRADTYCPACTLALLLEGEGIQGHGLSHVPQEAIDRLGVSQFGSDAYGDERNWDSDDFPKVIFRDQAENDLCGECGAILENGASVRYTPPGNLHYDETHGCYRTDA